MKSAETNSNRNLPAMTVVAALAATLLLPTAALADARVNNELENVTGNVVVLDFGQLGPAGTPVTSGDFVDKGYDLTTLKAGIAFQGGGSGEVRQQGNDWAGNFAPGGFLLWTNSPGQGPLGLQFNTPIAEVGTQIQTDFYGPFVAGIAAYDVNSNLLGFFTEAGISNGSGDGSAIFLGVNDDVPEISSIVYSIVSCTNDCNDFAISQITTSTATP